MTRAKRTIPEPEDTSTALALLTLSLRADSGYESSEKWRISADQWARILGICAEEQIEKDARKAAR